MTQEEKQLLIKDLCARLPYRVIVHINDYWDKNYPRPNEVLTTHSLSQYEKDLERWNIKPYLRPMSSMTEEEREHLQTLHDIISDENYGDGFSPAAWEAILDFNNYCREHHLDNGGLIPMGLALEAPKDMYNTN
jgi:hypothetical protein